MNKLTGQHQTVERLLATSHANVIQACSSHSGSCAGQLVRTRTMLRASPGAVKRDCARKKAAAENSSIASPPVHKRPTGCGNSGRMLARLYANGILAVV